MTAAFLLLFKCCGSCFFGPVVLHVYVSSCLCLYMCLCLGICLCLYLYVCLCLCICLSMCVYLCLCLFLSMSVSATRFFVIHNGPRITSTAASPLASSCPEDAAPIAPVLLLDGAARRAGAAAATAADTTIG